MNEIFPLLAHTCCSVTVCRNAFFGCGLSRYVSICPNCLGKLFTSINIDCGYFSIIPMKVHWSNRCFANSSISTSLWPSSIVPVVALPPRKRVMRLLAPIRHALHWSHASNVPSFRFFLIYIAVAFLAVRASKNG